MKDKVLVRVAIPMGDMAYDIRVPYDLRCATVTEMIVKMVRNLDQENLPISESPIMWLSKEGCILDDNKTFREYGITDSDMILLV